ncbi:DUF4190 domain-containing protein [Rhabdothermincola salaria]|uniref:DUF4190 domain-containing protein n=1 Tax=Rhabdothermincola salaria TaxID=2903142 RepID=UPI001E5FE686|nr:DUF4190 domain-containing protein [Rhabdothermincola salaria]MCD9622845.1 DUF4190 domain-containing protein [Rhabdothermincola salaria]
MSDQNLGTPAGQTKTNSKATWSLVLGILSITICGLIAGILAIIIGKQAQREIIASGGLQGGEVRAKWGIILGWISIAIAVLAGIIAAIAYAGN